MESTLPLTLRELEHATELKDASCLLGRGMCYNPANLRAFAIPDADRRCRSLARFFAPVLHGLLKRGLILGAFRDGSLVGVCGMARPGLCQPTMMEKLSVVPSLIFDNPFGTPMRVLRWTGEWAGRDLPEPHWHLGPVAIDSHMQGQGIGSAMLLDFCERMDKYGALSYLETDKSENVHFYQKFGFKVIAKAHILDVPNWFMSRPSRMATEADSKSLVARSQSRMSPASE